MQINVYKTVGSSGISIKLDSKKAKITLDSAQRVATELFALLPEPALTSGENGVNVFAGLPMPLFRPEDETQQQ
jgi:hypothetical protein